MGIIFTVVAIVFILFAVFWLNFRPKLLASATNTLFPLNTTQINQIRQTGNGFFLYSGDTILIFFYFMLILATFISASHEGADAQALPLGLPLLILAILVSMPISDFAHAFITSPSLASAATWYKGTLYIEDNLPTFTALGTLAYLVFVITRRGGVGFGGYGGMKVNSG